MVQAPPGYYEQKAIQTKEMLRLVNSHRCPLCGAQLDGGVYSTVADVFCRANPDEYSAKYKRGTSVPVSSVQRIYYTETLYEVDSTHLYEDTYRNLIYTVNMTVNARERMKTKKKIVDLECARIVLSNKLDEPNLLRKIKAYRLFG
jgi:hypothetical protein